MPRCAVVFAIFVALFSGTVFGQQHAVDPAQRYHRLICLVHLRGTGTAADPIRPEYVPDEEERARSKRSGILAWTFQITDDGTMAIVHLAAADRKAFERILADTRPEIRVFEIGKDGRAAIEAAMQQYKQGFSLDSLRMVVQ
jgi:hypothetical protein